MYHYVYRITNTVLKKHYYGKRSSTIPPVQDLGVYYFSSSTDKVFKQDQKTNPQNYRYKIVFMYDTADKALEREIALHAKFKVAEHSAFFNKAQQLHKGFSMFGKVHSADTIQKMRNRAKNRTWSEEAKLSLKKPKSFLHKVNMSKAKLHKPLSADHIRAVQTAAKARTGIPMSKQAVEKSTQARIKYANIYEYLTGTCIAQQVCITHWAAAHGYNGTSLQKTAYADLSIPSTRKNKHHHKNLYVRYT